MYVYKCTYFNICHIPISYCGVDNLWACSQSRHSQVVADLLFVHEWCPEDTVSFNTLLRAFDTTCSTSPRIGTSVPGWSLGLLVLRTFLGSRLMPRVITFSACVSSCATAKKKLDCKSDGFAFLGIWEVRERQGLLVRRPGGLPNVMPNVGFQTLPNITQLDST